MLRIRSLAAEDRDRVLEWRNQPDVRRWMYTDREITEPEHREWFGGVLGDPTRRYWVLEWESAPVGVVNLADISVDQGRCEWGIYVAEAAARGTGAALGASFLSLDAAFHELQLDRVSCEAIAGNERAIALYERVGFRREGLRRSHVARGGGDRADVVVFGLLRSEWEVLRPGLLAGLSDRRILDAEVNDA